MTEWTTTEDGAFCSEACLLTTLPHCCVCNIPMREWKENSEGQYFCSDSCIQTTLPRCCVCNIPMREWKEDSDGQYFCSETCIETRLPRCKVCNKPMHEWHIIDDDTYCTMSCIGKTLEYYRISDVEASMGHLGYETLDVLITGSTGVGKSSTINCLFKKDVSKVGHGADPETMDITQYVRGNHISVWDTPGFGDSVVHDRAHAEKIIRLLNTRINGKMQYAFIDMVVILVDASSRDMGTTFSLINDTILPQLEDGSRIVVGLNQADFALHGQHFDRKTNKPDEELLAHLDEKSASVRRRIAESTGIRNVNVVYYSAVTGYNITKLLDAIIDNIPSKKRYLG